VIRLREGETNMLAGSSRRRAHDARRRAGAERHPGHRQVVRPQHQDDGSDRHILTLTPHIIRVLDLTEADLRPFRVGRDSLAPIAELPPIEPAEAGAAKGRRPIDGRTEKTRRPWRSMSTTLNAELAERAERL